MLSAQSLGLDWQIANRRQRNRLHICYLHLKLVNVWRYISEPRLAAAYLSLRPAVADIEFWMQIRTSLLIVPSNNVSDWVNRIINSSGEDSESSKFEPWKPETGRATPCEDTSHEWLSRS